MKILITGSNGFIGKNLSIHLKEQGHDIFKFTRDSKIDDLLEVVKESELIFHLAGENRPNNDEDFYKGNADLTQHLCDYVRSYAKGVPIIFSSTKKISEQTSYGKSKLLAEEYLSKLSESNPIYILRLPGVFGKWSKPNYNSVVATFCYNIIRGLPININDPNAKIELLYIDDLISEFVNIINKRDKSNDVYLYNISKTVFINLNDLADMILSFNELRGISKVADTANGFEKNLYATFVSYLTADKFSYKLKPHIDSRGIFAEIIKTKSSGQFSYFTASPSEVRGEHYHHTKTEKFLIVKGIGRFVFRNIITNEKFEIETAADDYQIVQTIPGWAHKIENISEEDLISFVWANENFDKNHADTYKEEVD